MVCVDVYNRQLILGSICKASIYQMRDSASLVMYLNPFE